MKDVLRNMDKSSGTLELIDGKMIKYFMMIENQKDYYLTTKEAPIVKNEDKYTNLYYKKNK